MSKTNRIISFVLALVFFVTSAGVGLWVLLTEVSKDDEPSPTNQSIINQEPSTVDNTTNQSNEDQQATLEGTKLQGFDPITVATTELQKIDTIEGTGAVVQPGATIVAHYTGAVASTGVIFQSSYDRGEPIEFSLAGVIKGWTDGVPGMKVGGKRRLVIPAEQAYGANPPAGSGIPVNADLVFDIELVSISE